MSEALKRNLVQYFVVLGVFLLVALPFKSLTIIDGVTDLRPVNAVTLLAGLCCGPVGALACATGNLVSDLFGTLSVYSISGFITNFIAAYLPYRVWHMVVKEPPNLHSIGRIMLFLVCCLYSSAVCSLMIGGAYDLGGTGLAPEVTRAVFINESLFTIVLGLPCLVVISSGVLGFGFKERPKAFLIKRIPGWPHVLFGNVSPRAFAVHVSLTAGCIISVVLVILTGYVGIGYLHPASTALTIVGIATAVILCL